MILQTSSMTEPQRVAVAIAYSLLDNWDERITDLKSDIADHTTVEVDEDFTNEVILAMYDLRITI